MSDQKNKLMRESLHETIILLQQQIIDGVK